MWYCTENQCSAFMLSVTWSWGPSSATILTAAFTIRCNGTIIDWGRPVTTEFSCNSQCTAESMQTEDASASFVLQIISIYTVVVDDRSTTMHSLRCALLESNYMLRSRTLSGLMVWWQQILYGDSHPLELIQSCLRSKGSQFYLVRI